jgi:hypothetical protein
MTQSQLNSALHNFDFELCLYIRGNMLRQSGGSRYHAELYLELEDPLIAYLGLGEIEPDDQHERLLLTSDEIDYMALAAADLSDRFRLEWEPYENLHRRSIGCVRELRNELSTEAGEEWSRKSNDFAKRLEQKQLSLEDGIYVVGEWIFEVRRYLAAIGWVSLLPLPQGNWPSPSRPLPPLVNTEVADSIATQLDENCPTKPIVNADEALLSGEHKQTNFLDLIVDVEKRTIKSSRTGKSLNLTGKAKFWAMFHTLYLAGSAGLSRPHVKKNFHKEWKHYRSTKSKLNSSLSPLSVCIAKGEWRLMNT